MGSRKKPGLGNFGRKTLKEQTMRMVVLEQIEVLDELQPRFMMDDELVDEYAQDMINNGTDHVTNNAGASWPALELSQVGGRVLLSDGFHRYKAAVSNGIKMFQATVKERTYREALAASFQYNGKHGKRRSNEDKRKAVQTALSDDEWVVWSNGKVAELCGVSEFLVRKVRDEMETAGKIIANLDRKSRGGKVMKTANIGSASIQSKLPPKPIGDVEGVQVRTHTRRPPGHGDDAEYPINPVSAPIVSQVKYYHAVNLTGWSEIAEDLDNNHVYITPKPKAGHVTIACDHMVNAVGSMVLCRAYVRTERHGELWVWGGDKIPELKLPDEFERKEDLIEMIENILVGEA